jgi:hypothetical protein
LKTGFFGNFELHDWSCSQSHETAPRIQVLKSSPKALHEIEFHIAAVSAIKQALLPGIQD